VSEKNDNVALEIASEFGKRRAVVLGGEITQSSIAEVASRLLSLQFESSEPITLLIDSGGGDVRAALSLCDLMTVVMSAKIRGVATAMCGSAATFVLLHCHERIATPYSRFLIHSSERQVSGVPINATSAEHLQHLLRDMQELDSMLIDMYAKRLTPHKKQKAGGMHDFVRKLMQRGDQRFGAFMSAEEALAIGLVTRIEKQSLGLFA